MLSLEIHKSGLQLQKTLKKYIEARKTKVDELNNRQCLFVFFF